MQLRTRRTNPVPIWVDSCVPCDDQLISGERAIRGSAVGTPTDSEDTMNFAALTGVRPMIETYPLEKAEEAYARMMSGKAEFRVVLMMGSAK